MLFALEWIRTQLAVIYSAITVFLEELTLEAITSFLGGTPVLTVLFILAGLTLVTVGFRTYKFISSIVGASVLGILGWHLGSAINPDVISASILVAFVFVIIGLSLFYILSVINTFLSTFIVFFAVFGELFILSTDAKVLISSAVALLYCILLIRLKYVWTAITGGMLLGLITLYFFGYITALCVLAICAAGGTLLQYFLHKRYEAKKAELRNFRPNAPVPPTPEEIAKEIESEAVERLAKRNVPRLSQMPGEITEETEVTETVETAAAAYEEMTDETEETAEVIA